MLPRIISKIPMKISVPLLFAAPVFIAVIVLSTLAFIQSTSTANELMSQNLVQIHDHIEERLDDLLNLPARIQQINANLIRNGLLELDDLRSWRRALIEQARSLESLSSITWGDAKGNSVGIMRLPEDAGFEFSIKDEQTGNFLETYFCTPRGRMDKKPSGSILYDPRNRPWYQAAIQAGSPGWTMPYAKFNKARKPVTLALGYTQPFQNSHGQIYGVMNAELTLNDITLFLEKLRVGRTGRAFIINTEGRLIATSTGVSITDASNYPVIASDTVDRYIAAAAKQIEASLGSLNAVKSRYQFNLEIYGEPYLLMTSPSIHTTGLTWIIATMVPESDFLTEVNTGRQRSIKIGIIAVLLTLLLGVILAAVSLRPILDLVAYVQKVGKGDLDSRLKLEYSTEFVRLSKEINAMTSDLRDRIRLRHSLALAQEVQQNLLPSDTPKIDGLDIAAHATYCDEIGGDYYDFLNIKGYPSTTAAIAVGDVAGHGVAEAMLMATARGILRSLCATTDSLAELLNHLNDYLVEDTSIDQFMTLLLLTIDANQNRMHWAAAGHEPPIVFDRAEDRFIELNGKSMSLGVVKEIKYKEQVFNEVRSGQIYLALTDGLWETFSPGGEMFGMDRVRDLIRRYADLPAAEIVEKILAELSDFRGQSSLEDDITFVIVKVI